MPGLLPAALGIVFAATAPAQTDPGIRLGAPAAGDPIEGVSPEEMKFFGAGIGAFAQPASITGSAGGTTPGLGPRFNLDSCGGCHAFPSLGGTSPRSNPQLEVAPATQVAPLVALRILAAAGPVRASRFRSDGAVHALFTIMGRPDTPLGCSIAQPDFAARAAEGALVFRIPTPAFGAGLIEAIPDSAIAAHESAVKPFGIAGRANRNKNDNTISRFGWKAQNKSLLLAAAEAFNVEQGVTNDLFPDDRGEAGVQDPPACRPVAAAQDHTNYTGVRPEEAPAGFVSAATFMRFLAAPSQAPSGYRTASATVTASSISSGRSLFHSTGCAVCHIPSMRTGHHSSAALASRTAELYSDLLLHRMGALGDGIRQGAAGPDEFRTAPLWGLGQRIYLLHDGRTSDLLDAIQAHALGGADGASEARLVIRDFNARTAAERQHILNFLRSL